MKPRVLGLVVEYNPFHYGHLFHLRAAKRITKPDFTVAVMSGNFTQRGEPAVVEKYARAETAVSLGVDLVLELPVVYSLQDAGGFATGAIRTLEHVGVDELVFGSETGETSLMEGVSEVLIEEPVEYRDRLKFHLKKGHSFPNARKYALRDFIGKSDSKLSFRMEELASSNNILGLEYLRAIKEIDSSMRPRAIKRKGAAYSDPTHRGRYSSATAVRKLLKLGEVKSVAQSIPKQSLKVLLREIRDGKGPVFAEDTEKFFIPYLRLIPREEYGSIYGFVEGLDARFCGCARGASSLEEFLACVKTKRFTLSRIKRLLYYPAFKFTKSLLESSNKLGPQYVRVLAFNEKGREYLSKIKKTVNVPVIVTPSLWKKTVTSALKRELEFEPDLLSEQLRRDFLAVSFYSSFYNSSVQRSKGSDLFARVYYDRGEE